MQVVRGHSDSLNIINTTFQIIALTSIVLMLGACSQQGADEQAATEAKARPVSKEQLLARRAEDRWQALVDLDMERSYGYLSPGTRQVMPLSVYVTKRVAGPAQVQGAVVKNTRCEDLVCTLEVELRYIYNGSVAAMRGQELTSTVKEKWIVSGENWFYVPD